MKTSDNINRYSIKQRYELIQEEAQEDWNDFTTWNDVLETVEGCLDVEVFGNPMMERFARQMAHAAAHGTLVQERTQ